MKEPIVNLGVSGSPAANPADYVYRRAEMETYVHEHAYFRFLAYEVFAHKQNLHTPRPLGP